MTDETRTSPDAGGADLTRGSGDGTSGTTTGGEVHEQVIGILNDVLQLDISTLTNDVDRAQVEQWDSVNHLRLVMELEQAFSVALSDDDVLEMQSLRGIETVLLRHGITGTFTPIGDT